jgi:predicted nucleic acid-binding protein
MPDPNPPCFFDPVVLSNFALAGRLDIVANRYGTRAVVTSEVLDEICEGVARGYADLKSIAELVRHAKLAHTTLSSDERDRHTYLLTILNSGEASCVACAEAREGRAVTDDRVARRICAERSVPVTGTIGILVASCAEQSIAADDADIVLQVMIDKGFYSPVRRISEIL